jgi:minor extracellular serine protease Vpr
VGVISGIAPGVTLHDFNVFPGVGAGIVNHNGGAFSHDIAEAIDDAIAAGVDVINMSLGGGVQGPNDFLAEAADAAVDAGIVVVCSAGNGGPGDSTVGSPGTGRKVIATGATSNPHFIGIPVTVGSSTYGAMLGEFAGFGVVAAPYTVTDPANGCGALATDLTGKIGLIDRGACTFGTKALNAEIAGALGALIVNNRAGDPIPMAADPAAPATIPVAMLGRADGNAIKPAGTMSIDGATQAEFKTASADILADFSSRGPAPFTRIIKPDVMAPGVNVYSSVFNFGPGGFGDIVYDFELFEGTSMAAPHVAGSAVLLLEKHPGWSPADVRSALVNNGARVVTDTLTGATDPGLLARGGGRVDLVAANDTPLTINPANASFGFWAGNSAVSGVINLKVKNVSGSAKTCAVSVTGPSIVTASPASLNLAAGATGVVRVRLNAGTSSKTGSGDYEGDVVITCNGATLRAPWFARIDRKAKP